jgi:hypothetical protein
MRAHAQGPDDFLLAAWFFRFVVFSIPRGITLEVRSPGRFQQRGSLEFGRAKYELF